MQRCLGCMREFDETIDVCPHCGYIVGTPAASKTHLAPGSVLQNRYTLGKALGQNDFGITYIAWDNKFERAFAVNEYFPAALVSRLPGEKEITCSNTEARREFDLSLAQKRKEAKELARFNTPESSVNVYDFFEENGTAYIIIELLRGRTVTEILSEHGVLSYTETSQIMTPIFKTLGAIHNAGHIHGEVCPDNIFVCEDGNVKLLNFDTKKLVGCIDDNTLSVMLHAGYAPPEQYSSKAKQGAFTDVYAASATMYKMLTGETPPESMSRKPDGSDLTALSQINIPQRTIQIILHGMAPKAADRIQSAAEMLHQLQMAGVITEPMPPHKKRWLLLAVIPVILAACVTAYCIHNAIENKPSVGSTDAVNTTSESMKQNVPETKSEPVSVSRETLKQLVSEQADYEILSFFCADYNADGSPEAFAVCGETDSDYTSDSDRGDDVTLVLTKYQLWFVNGQKTKLVEETVDDSRPTNIDCAKMIPVSHETDVQAFMISTGPTYPWYRLFLIDKEGNPFESVSGPDYEPALVPEQVGNWVALQESHIMPFGCRISYFEYDADAHDFVRLGGLEITESDLKHVSGTKEVFEILSKENAIIDSIYYRANGIVNINYYRGDLVSEQFNIEDPSFDDFGARAAMTLIIRDGKAQILERQDEELVGMNFFTEASPVEGEEFAGNNCRTSTPETFPY